MMHLAISAVSLASSSWCLSKGRTSGAACWLLGIVRRMGSDVLDHRVIICLSHTGIHVEPSRPICFHSLDILGVLLVLNRQYGLILIFRVTEVIGHHQAILIDHCLLSIWPYHVDSSRSWMISHGAHVLGGLWSLQWRGDVVVRSMGFKLLHLSSRSKAWWMI